MKTAVVRPEAIPVRNIAETNETAVTSWRGILSAFLLGILFVLEGIHGIVTGSFFIMQDMEPDVVRYAVLVGAVILLWVISALYFSRIAADEKRLLLFGTAARLVNTPAVLLGGILLTGAVTNQVEEGTALLEALKQNAAIFVVLLAQTVWTEVLRAWMIGIRDHEDDEKPVPAASPAIAAVLLSLSFLSTVILLAELAYIFPLRSGHSLGAWLMSLPSYLRSRGSMPFLNVYQINRPSWALVLAGIRSSFREAGAAYLLCLAPVIVMAFFSAADAALQKAGVMYKAGAQTLRDLCERSNKIFSQIPHTTCRCPEHRDAKPIAVYPFPLDRLRVEQADLIPGVHEAIREKALRDGMDPDAAAADATFTREDATVYAGTSGERLQPTHFICGECYNTIPRTMTGRGKNRGEIITVHVTASMMTGKTTAHAALKYALCCLNAPGSYDRYYWDTVTQDFPAELPDDTPTNIYRAPPLLLEYNSHVFSFTDHAGEHSDLLAATHRGGVLMLCIDIQDPGSVKHAVTILRTMLAARKIPRRIVIVLTKADRIDDTPELMKKRGIHKRSEAVRNFLIECSDEQDGLRELVKTADAFERRAIKPLYTMFSATGGPCEGKKPLAGKAEPQYVEELMQALLGEGLA